MPIQETVTFTGYILEEREKSYRMEVGENEHWFPKSQLTDNQDGSYSIPKWLADKMGIEE